MPTSGTTGPPKRIPVRVAQLEAALANASQFRGGRREPEAALSLAVAILYAPLVHLGGIWGLISSVAEGRRICLLERFTVEAWRDAVVRHRPAAASLVPAALRMLLDADVPKQDLASLRAVVSGTAPVPPETAAAFEARFGIPVLVTYGATEFAGGVASWTLRDWKEWSERKRGSVGRAHPGCELRVVELDGGGVLAAGERGLLEVRSAQLGEGSEAWVRTTDLASLDAEGFLWIHGRADSVIIRGGFKISPPEVERVLAAYPGVREAAVVGLPDERLGQVPVAAVELEPGAAPVDPEALRSFARERLAPYQVPARVLVVAALPRTLALKVSEPQVRQLFALDAP
jgi:acyl-coenzyme A synthetase/AMP-(fatty) acid ligase